MIKSMRMRNVFAFLVSSSLFASPAAIVPSAYAEVAPGKVPLTAPLTPVQTGPDSEQKPAPDTAQTSEERLDKLFADLRRTTDEAKARRIASQINTLWSQSGSATVDLLMQWANAAMLERRYPSAIDFLNEAIALDPEYAEAWNRRATVYFLQKDYAHAMYDINRTLELEPRHYGALTGMAAILRLRGLKEQALKAYEQALIVYPMMRDAQKNFNDLADELTDTRT
ncbi:MULTISPECIES: tetratricopeptide repeat protein [Brucella/Ochrobactrum group]|uniref:Tetratricopeptide repeat protein n=1 Tax=Brucella pseudintermedia TaxID=370111 RepID=A0ABY5U7N2_9HYPH|nr:MULTISPECIES: tetratricopeptide repeat protein [Brucella/Ochrobactrum group]KAB2680181.1 tetratricopeptide repeat protein [Brucella pseudintermedia]NKE77696.1 tetratricopeptide repeat protein [Ochrobactrum sp. MC-1LL]TWG95259.1 tetratricopeptide repeat protein [Ochrobactrum sp. J50]UWL59349.1 tetratricopeptide repeat protein [Brucella pseudintermedia]WPM79768.1 tetratricopeptide repeat protein [Brucella pseudintermedia]